MTNFRKFLILFVAIAARTLKDKPRRARRDLLGQNRLSNNLEGIKALIHNGDIHHGFGEKNRGPTPLEQVFSNLFKPVEEFLKKSSFNSVKKSNSGKIYKVSRRGRFRLSNSVKKSFKCSFSYCPHFFGKLFKYE